MFLICKADTLYIVHEAAQESFNEGFYDFTLNDVLTLFFTAISLWFAFVQFKKQLKLNREAQIDANKKNWYLTVIIVPQLEGINRFFQVFVEEIQHNVQSISLSKDEVQLGQMQAEAKEQINSYFDHLQSLFNSYDKTIAKRISSSVMDLEDTATIILNDVCFDVDEYTSNRVRRELLMYKSIIIGILYDNIKKEAA